MYTYDIIANDCDIYTFKSHFLVQNCQLVNSRRCPFAENMFVCVFQMDGARNLQVQNGHAHPVTASLSINSLSHTHGGVCVSLSHTHKRWCV